MEFPSEFRPIDQTSRRREASAKSGPTVNPGTGTIPKTDDIQTRDADTVERYVRMAQAHSRDPGRLDEVRRQLAEGTFTASPEELANRFLDGEGA